MVCDVGDPRFGDSRSQPLAEIQSVVLQMQGDDDGFRQVAVTVGCPAYQPAMASMACSKPAENSTSSSAKAGVSQSPDVIR